jgi:preprotein translocase subunit SecE
MGPNKQVQLMFLSGGVLLYLLLKWTSEWVLGYFVRRVESYEWYLIGGAALLALAIGIYSYANERVYTLATDVAGELKKVTWPTRKETQAATIVVIVTVIIAAIILGVFDAIWSATTDSIYG